MVRVTLFPLLIEWGVRRKRSESLWQWNGTNLGLCFILLVYNCCLFPVAIYFLFMLGTTILPWLLGFHSWDIHFKNISQTFPLPTTSSPSQTNFQISKNFQKYWICKNVGMFFLFGDSFLWRIQHGLLTRGRGWGESVLTLRIFVAIFTSLLLKWCWVESL